MAGDKDRLANIDTLRARVAAFPQQANLVVVPGADHSWRDHEAELAQQVTDFLTKVL